MKIKCNICGKEHKDENLYIFYADINNPQSETIRFCEVCSDNSNMHSDYTTNTTIIKHNNKKYHGCFM